MKENTKKTRITDILLVALSAIFFVGLLTFLGPCGPKDDGTFMTCHWAGQALKGIAAVLLITSVIHLFVKAPGIKQGLSLAMIPAALLSAFLPGNLISLCMMNTMRCHSVMRTSSVIISLLIIAAAVLDLVVQRK